MTVRHPAVAGQFYPGHPAQLAATLEQLTPKVPVSKKIRAFGIVVPHAGYIYSGRTAAETVAHVQVPETCLILGPNHHGRGAPLAMMSEGSWDFPLGMVALNQTLAGLVRDLCPLVTEDSSAHRFEHSLEVQVPFLYLAQSRLSITPIAVSHLSYDHCQAVGEALALAIKLYQKPVLLVASTDMTHYQPRDVASRQDRLALEKILHLEPAGLYRTVLDHGITMCGFIPTTIALIAALALGATTAELIRYTDSGEASGDTSQVVGYAGLVLS